MRTEKRDYYEVLEISRTATIDEIKRAYKGMARKWHPDVNKDPSAEDRFKEISEAYEILSAEEKRSAYDRFGHAGTNGSASGFTGTAGFGGLDEIFNMFVNMGGGRSAAPGSMAERGDDLRHDVELTLEEAAVGVEKKVRFTRRENCDICSGTGAMPGTQVSVCPTCGGHGVVRHTQNTLLGTFQTSATCTRCRGEGRAISSPCAQCNGSGRMRKTRDKAIKIPAGVDSGSRMRLVGEGDAGIRGGHSGDLYVVLYIKPHHVFERRNDDLYCEVPISFVRAALGGQITVPTILGEEHLTIPEGTQSGASFKLRDKGMPQISGRGKGDEYVIVRVQVPTRLTADQKQILGQLALSMGEEPETPAEKSFLGRLFGGDK